MFHILDDILKCPCSNGIQKLILVTCEFAIPIHIFKQPRVESGKLETCKGKRLVYNK